MVDFKKRLKAKKKAAAKKKLPPMETVFKWRVKKTRFKDLSALEHVRWRIVNYQWVCWTAFREAFRLVKKQGRVVTDTLPDGRRRLYKAQGGVLHMEYVDQKPHLPGVAKRMHLAEMRLSRAYLFLRVADDILEECVYRWVPEMREKAKCCGVDKVTIHSREYIFKRDYDSQGEIRTVRWFFPDCNEHADTFQEYELSP